MHIGRLSLPNTIAVSSLLLTGAGSIPLTPPSPQDHTSAVNEPSANITSGADDGTLALMEKRQRYSFARFTWYPTDTGPDACTGRNHDDNDFLVALNMPLFGRNGNGHCGKQIRITARGKSAIATIADACASCPSPNQIDLTKGLFKFFDSDLSDGVIYGSWEFVTGGSPGPSFSPPPPPSPPGESQSQSQSQSQSHSQSQAKSKSKSKMKMKASSRGRWSKHRKSRRVDADSDEAHDPLFVSTPDPRNAVAITRANAGEDGSRYTRRNLYDRDLSAIDPNPNPQRPKGLEPLGSAAAGGIMPIPTQPSAETPGSTIPESNSGENGSDDNNSPLGHGQGFSLPKAQPAPVPAPNPNPSSNSGNPIPQVPQPVAGLNPESSPAQGQTNILPTENAVPAPIPTLPSSPLPTSPLLDPGLGVLPVGLGTDSPLPTGVISESGRILKEIVDVVNVNGQNKTMTRYNYVTASSGNGSVLFSGAKGMEVGRISKQCVIFGVLVMGLGMVV